MKDQGRYESIDIVLQPEQQKPDQRVGAPVHGAVPSPKVGNSELHKQTSIIHRSESRAPQVIAVLTAGSSACSVTPLSLRQANLKELSPNQDDETQILTPPVWLGPPGHWRAAIRSRFLRRPGGRRSRASATRWDG